MDIDEILAVRDEAIETTKKEKKLPSRKKAKVKKLTKKELAIRELASNTVTPDHYETVWTEEQLHKMIEFLNGHEYIALDTETMGLTWMTDEIVGLSVYAPHKGYYIPLKHYQDININEEEREKLKQIESPILGTDYVECLPKDVVIKALKPLIEDGGKKWIFHNYKFDFHIMNKWMGIKLDCHFDTMIAQALLDENHSKALKDMAVTYLKVPADRYGTIFGKTTFDRVPILESQITRAGNLATYYATKDVELTFNMFRFQEKHLNHPSLEKINKLFYEIEIPFLKIVRDAETYGVKLDSDYLINVVGKELNAELEELRQKIWAITGQINLNSPVQLSKVLYGDLKLPRVNNKKGDSTDKKTLNKLKGHHPVVKMILDYREKTKLSTAFVEKLPKKAVNGRIHTSFNPVGAKTGRMSSRDPNCQQIPARLGNLIRNAFISDEGRLLASIDFSQQELRVLAHISKDPVLLDVYKNGKDVHSQTAVSMYNIQNPRNQVTYENFEYCRNMMGNFQDEDGKLDKSLLNDSKYKDKLFAEGTINTTDTDILIGDCEKGIKFEKIRKNAKTVNFGIVYGMAEFTLAENLEISVEEAVQYIKAYFAQYPNVKKEMKVQHKKIAQVKYVETLLGRKRRFHKVMKEGEFWQIASAERQCFNAIIQGSSADMVKLASIKLQKLLKELDVRIVLWVHDEIIFDVPENIGMDNLRRIAEIMCTALPLDCGLKSDIEVGKKWGQKLKEDELNELADLFEDE